MGNLIVGFMSGIIVTMCGFLFTELFDDYKEHRKRRKKTD